MDRLAAMQAFVSVAEAGSFAAAARRLGVAKSAVTKRLAQLEEHLGVRLIDRTTRAQALTDAGAAHLARARQILADLADAEAALTDLQRAPGGLLRLAAPTSFGTLQLAPALSELLASCPELACELILNDREVHPVEEGFDFVIRDVPVERGSLRQERLAAHRRVVCAAPAYLARAGTPDAPQALTRHDCIHYSYLASGPVWSFVVGGQPRTVRVRVRVASNNGMVMRAAALAGHGIALLPAFLVGDDLAAGRLVAVLQRYPLPAFDIVALYARERRLNAKVGRVLDFLKARFAEAPWNAPEAGA
jgi:DNA-binding transcriptional LysR family regulator